MKLFRNEERARQKYEEYIPLVLYNETGEAACKWCEKHKSKGRFYNANDGWYFEKKNDALLFALKWSVR